MNRNISISLNLIAALSVFQMRILVYACTSPQLQDFRYNTTPKGKCIEVQDCNETIIQEIMVCFSGQCPIGGIKQTTAYSNNTCSCPFSQISSDFSICSEKCPNSEIAQQDSKLCLSSINECVFYLTQDLTMCGQNVCVPNQQINVVGLVKVCTCQSNMKYFDLKTKSCMNMCPTDQVTEVINNLCLVTITDCKEVMSSDKKTCGTYQVCNFNDYMSLANASRPYTICLPCPETSPLSVYASINCYSCYPKISDLVTGNCLENPSECTGSRIISSDGKRCSDTCKVGEHISKEAGYLQCRNMSKCPLVDTRISPNVCLSSFEDCIDGFISNDEKSCLNICPYEQYSTETMLIPQEFQYNKCKKCINSMSEIVLISVGFVLFATFSSFLLSYEIIKAKRVNQESKYIRDIFPVRTEEDDICF